MKKAGVLFILSGVGEFILSKVEVLSLSLVKNVIIFQIMSQMRRFCRPLF